jgi:hypothetical protein
MAAYLENLKLTELSFVDRPANLHAKVSIFKAVNPLLPSRNPLMPLPVTKAKAASAPVVERDPKSTRVRSNPVRNEAEAAARFDQDGDENMEPKTFDEAVNQIATRDSVPRSVAMGRARKAYPALYATYQAQGNAAVAKAAPRPVEKSDAVAAFEKCIDRVQSRERCSRLTALTKAAREFPREREAYAGALS